MLSRFTKWLTSVDGGKKPLTQANKDKRVVMTVVRHNNDETTDYRYLACPSFLNKWMTKLNKEKKEPGTIKTYLTSVKHFIDFCEAERNNILKDQNVSQVNILICKWRNTLRKEAQKKQPEKELIARENFPTAEQILNFDKSEKVKNAKRIIINSQVSNRFKMRKGNHCEARDYLLTSLIFDNASRPGVISNNDVR